MLEKKLFKKRGFQNQQIGFLQTFVKQGVKRLMPETPDGELVGVQKAVGEFRVLMEKVQELRQIKNRLAAIALLSQSHQFNSNPEIGAGLSLQEKLP